jgi:hypothetical protein
MAREYKGNAFARRSYVESIDKFLASLLLPGNPTAVGVEEFTEGQKKLIVGRLKIMFRDDNPRFDPDKFDKYLAKKLKVGEGK